MRIKGTDRLPPPPPPPPPTAGSDEPPPVEVVPDEPLLPPMRAARALTPAERRRLVKLERRVAPLLLSGKNTQAIKLLDEIVSLSPGNAKAYRNLAMAWRSLGDESRGAAYQQRAEQLAPSSTPAIELDGDKNDGALDEVSSGEPGTDPGGDAPFGGAP